MSAVVGSGTGGDDGDGRGGSGNFPNKTLKSEEENDMEEVLRQATEANESRRKKKEPAKKKATPKKPAAPRGRYTKKGKTSRDEGPPEMSRSMSDLFGTSDVMSSVNQHRPCTSQQSQFFLPAPISAASGVADYGGWHGVAGGFENGLLSKNAQDMMKKTDRNYDLAKSCERKMKSVEIAIKSLVETFSKLQHDFVTNIDLVVNTAVQATLQGSIQMDVGTIPDLANSDPPGIGAGGGVHQVSQASTISQMSPPLIAQMVPIRQTSNISQAPNINLSQPPPVSQASSTVVQVNQQVDGAMGLSQVLSDPQGGMQVDPFVQQMLGDSFNNQSGVQFDGGRNNDTSGGGTSYGGQYVGWGRLGQYGRGGNSDNLTGGGQFGVGRMGDMNGGGGAYGGNFRGRGNGPFARGGGGGNPGFLGGYEGNYRGGRRRNCRGGSGY